MNKLNVLEASQIGVVLWMLVMLGGTLLAMKLKKNPTARISGYHGKQWSTNVEIYQPWFPTIRNAPRWVRGIPALMKMRETVEEVGENE